MAEGVTRRGFFAFCGAVASAAALPGKEAVVDVPTNPHGTPIYYYYCENEAPSLFELIEDMEIDREALYGTADAAAYAYANSRESNNADLRIRMPIVPAGFRA